MEGQMTFEFDKRPTIKGYPELRWTGKRPYESTQYYPAQLRERYGEETNGWINKIFWGDNLQVMSHLLKEYRGEIDLIYIDPPFDSKADYKKSIRIKSNSATSDTASFEEKQYGDIWNNDGYLQFMYERLIIMRELLSDSGTLYLHCDWHQSSHLRCILDELFGPMNCHNVITWKRSHAQGNAGQGTEHFGIVTDTIFIYSKTGHPIWNQQYLAYSKETMQSLYEAGEIQLSSTGKSLSRRRYLKDAKGTPVTDLWDDLNRVSPTSSERLDYPTQKPECLLERIMRTSSNPESLVFDCFMGSGTTQAVAMKLGRKFIGADINLGSIQTTTKRLINVAKELDSQLQENQKYTGFEVYNVNNYDFFRNPLEARDLIIQALEIQPFPQSDVWDGELDGRMVKIMPVNRIATKADLEELKANLPYKTYEKRKADNPTQPVERITIVCMGHEPDLKASLEQGLSEYKLDIEIVDILRDKKDLQLKREAEAEIVKEGSKLVIRSFYPMNLMQKLSLQKEYVEDWRQLVESIMIDWNYDGVVMQPTITDVPDKKEIVSGIYDIPEDAGTIRVKITDLLSESLEMEVE